MKAEMVGKRLGIVVWRPGFKNAVMIEQQLHDNGVLRRIVAWRNGPPPRGAEPDDEKNCEHPREGRRRQPFLTRNMAQSPKENAFDASAVFSDQQATCKKP